jgi:hypothetical protein
VFIVSERVIHRLAMELIRPVNVTVTHFHIFGFKLQHIVEAGLELHTVLIKKTNNVGAEE